ncbi:MAG: hypothetical protein Q9219_006626 [cf. Caloplaca sp. 3 TL-2023]
MLQTQRPSAISGASEGVGLDLKPDAISSLTKKIETNLKKSQPGKLPPKAKRISEAGKRGRVPEKTGKSSEPNGQQHPVPTFKQDAKTPAPGPKPQGKKRSRDGKVKDQTQSKSELNDAPPKSKTEKQDGLDRARLEQEILALGGNKDDLKLIEGADSGSEYEGGIAGPEKPARKGLKKELLQLVQELGIENAAKTLNECSGSDSDKDSSDVHGSGVGVVKTLAKEATIFKRAGKMTPQFEVDPTSEWHAVVVPSLTSPDATVQGLPPELIARVHTFAKSLLDKENELYASHTGSAQSAQQFYSTIMSSGTLSDKISALTLSVQESPLHNIRALETLVGLARKRSRGQAVEVLGALKDLFGLGSVLPPDRKLRTFAMQPDLSIAFRSNKKWTSNDPLPKSLTEAHLVLWAFEDWLKAIYFEILKILETWCNDEVVFARGKAVNYVCQLLKEKPEQEANLLRLLVNKLGDSDNKVASKTSYQILQLETAHPLMKPTIISAIEADLLFRPGQSPHAQYYAVITLNQTVLNGKEESVARKLLDIYFRLFTMLLAKPQPVKTPGPEATVTKINRKGEVQGGGGPAGKAARRKSALKEKATTVEDDLREKMLSAVLTGVNRAVPFANTNDDIFEKHMDTLFRITHSSNFNTSIQALMLIQQLTGTHQGSFDRFYRTLYESLLDPRLLTSSKQALYLNLLFKSLRSDLNVKRVKAFTKRLLQVVSMHQPAFTCGAMYMFRELEATFANLSSYVDEKEDDDSDEEEVFHDVQETESFPAAPHTAKETTTAQRPRKEMYNGRKRDPEHSNADRTSLWEITPFLNHYHPSVSLFATKLLTHAPMPSKPDLASHTLIHFLDRFVYRNPKTNVQARGTSIMQPLSSSALDNNYDRNRSNLLLSSAPSFRDRIKQPVNSEAFWKQEADKVAADEVFFHRYFGMVGRGREKARGRKERRNKKNKVSGGGVEDGSEDEEEEEEEEEIWKALVESRPEVEGEEEDDDDDDDEGAFEAEDIDMEEEEEEDGENGPAPTLGSGNDDNNDDDDAAMPDFLQGDDASLLASEDDVPTHLQAVFEKEVQTERADGRGLQVTEKEKKKGSRREKRMKLKHLPVFAEADEYAGVLEGEGEGEEEDV